MARLRRARPAEGELESIASALSGFHEDVIDAACTSIEESEVRRGEAKLPSLGKLVNVCRAQAQRLPPSPNTWTRERYHICKIFDAYIDDQVEHYGRPLAEVCMKYPDTARAWAAWKRQIREGTIECPGWCDTCNAMRWIIQHDDPRGASMALPCPECRRK